MRKTALILIIIGLAVLIFFKSNPKQNTGKLSVITSIYPLYYFSSQIAGDKAEVINLIPSGVEPHDYEPKAGDIAKLEKSNLVILNGYGMEPWAKNISNEVIASEGITAINNDPHFWLSPVLAKQMVDNILKGFNRFGDYNGNQLKLKLDELDKEYRDGLSNCKLNSFISSHNAFGYLAKEYGLTQIPISGLSPDSEPSPKQMMDIVDMARRNNIKYVFYEKLASPKLSETIAKEINGQVMELNPIEGEGNDYFSEMRNNLNNLKIALECKQ